MFSVFCLLKLLKTEVGLLKRFIFKFMTTVFKQKIISNSNCMIKK